MKEKILVFGASGFLGESLCHHFSLTGINYMRVGRSLKDQYQFTTNRFENLRLVFLKESPSTVFNLIAATNVDWCENNAQLAYESNVLIVHILKQLQYEFGFKVVHISTDQVYGGSGPHHESDRAIPINVYGRTKLEAESLLDQNTDLICRTNFVGRSRSDRKISWTDWVIGELRSERLIRIRKNSWFNPLHVSYLCGVLSVALSHNLSGTYNLASTDYATKVSFARNLARGLRLDYSLVVEAHESYGAGNAPRSLDLRMNTDKFTASTGILLPSVASVIKQCASEYGDLT